MKAFWKWLGDWWERQWCHCDRCGKRVDLFWGQTRCFPCLWRESEQKRQEESRLKAEAENTRLVANIVKALEVYEASKVAEGSTEK